MITCKSSINIALVKYWGKADQQLVIPSNDSFSITLSKESLCSTTEVQLCEDEKVTLELNGQACEVTTRIQQVVDAVRAKSNSKQGVKIVSSNNFNTAAGLASSSSGLSCLAVALCKLFGVECSTDQMTVLARLGSGSACRSVLGGFVQWHRGFDDPCELKDSPNAVSEQSIATRYQFDTEKWWIQNLRVLICVVKPDLGQGKVKEIGSTEGMQRSAQTSELLQLRLDKNLPGKHIEQMKKCLQACDFPEFAKLTMQESNQLHAIMQDTYPPLVYQNSTSRQIIKAITALNEQKIKAAYSIDAGFHVFVFCLVETLEAVQGAIQQSCEGLLERIIETGIDTEGVQ